MISVCIGYYNAPGNNREKLLHNTLKSIDESKVTDAEIIIIDDQSPIKLLHVECKYPVTLVRLENKCWVNPCVANNVALSLARGSKIVLQNPECRHVGDVLKYFEDNLTPGNWLSLACKALDANGRFFKWYNHPKFRPVGYPFCAGICREDLIFYDLAYKYGACYEDDDLLLKLKKKGINIINVGDIWVEHQWHGDSLWKGVPSNRLIFEASK